VVGQPITDGGVQLSQGIDIVSVAAQPVELRVVIGPCPSGGGQSRWLALEPVVVTQPAGTASPSLKQRADRR
jgi:hypothetical protein